MKLIASILTIFIVWPVAFFLQWSVLKMVGATDLMWLLFWGSVPLTMICALIIVIAEAIDKQV